MIAIKGLAVIFDLLLIFIRSPNTNTNITLLANMNFTSYRFCGLLQFPGARRAALSQTMLLLCHAFPKVQPPSQGLHAALFICLFYHLLCVHVNKGL